MKCVSFSATSGHELELGKYDSGSLTDGADHTLETIRLSFVDGMPIFEVDIFSGGEKAKRQYREHIIASVKVIHRVDHGRSFLANQTYYCDSTYRQPRFGLLILDDGISRVGVCRAAVIIPKYRSRGREGHLIERPLDFYVLLSEMRG